MKHNVMAMALLFGVVMMTFADTPRLPRGSEPVTVNGNLSIAQGKIALIQDDVTYYVKGIHQFIGFIDGLKEGASVVLEGNAIPNRSNEKAKILLVTKMTLNGKNYDVMPPGTRGFRKEKRGMMGHF
ncbi:MAG: hypothetical protein LBD22_02410 [Spirochaetaceae bacterium]|jgi:hypothetical protein|nr:hypothetical protein [Spirochaetaceae bacterium]